MPGEQQDHVWLELMLAQFHEDLKSIERSQSDYAKDLTRTQEMIKTLDEKVDHLTKTVSTGNGQPALVTQVAQLRNSMDALQLTINNKTIPPAVREARWKTFAAVAAAVGAIIPGVLALLGVHM